MPNHCFATTLTAETLKIMVRFINKHNMHKYTLFAKTENEDILRFIFVELSPATLKRLSKIDLNKLVEVAQRTNEGHPDFAIINHKLLTLKRTTIKETKIMQGKLDEFEFNPIIIETSETSETSKVEYNQSKELKELLHDHKNIRKIRDILYHNDNKNVLFNNYNNNDLIFILIHIKLSLLSKLNKEDINKLLSIKTDIDHINDRIESFKIRLETHKLRIKA